MATAIISDTHVGGLSGEGLLEHPEVREVLLTEIAGAERVVLLGDIVEMRDLPIGVSLELAEPFLRAFADAVRGAEVIYVPGNHDHHVAEPIIDAAAQPGSPPLGLEQRDEPRSPTAMALAEALGGCELSIAYPGAWLREDVYATHGHHMDPHLTLPRAECVAAAAVARLRGPLPDPATPADYERLLGPVYGLTYGLAQAGVWKRAGGAARPSERAFTWLVRSGSGGRVRGRVGSATGALAMRAGTAAVNRLLHADFEPDISVGAINAGGIAAGKELARRQRIGAAHVITGHTHHAGPAPGQSWLIEGGGELHNTGNWIYARLLAGARAGGPFWPGTLTWLGETGPPERKRLLDDFAPATLRELTGRARTAREALPLS